MLAKNCSANKKTIGRYCYLLDATLTQTLNYTAQSGDYGHTYFYVEHGNTYFQGTPTAFALNGSAAVPEPAAVGLFALGLCGVVGMRRRQRIAPI